MQKGDPLSLRSHPGLVVYQSDSGQAASLERRSQVADLEADVMYRRPAAGDELPDRRIIINRLEQLDERAARIQSADPGSVHRRQLYRVHPQNVPVKGKSVGDRAHRNADVRDSDTLRG